MMLTKEYLENKIWKENKSLSQISKVTNIPWSTLKLFAKKQKLLTFDD